MMQLDFIGQPTQEKAPEEQYEFWTHGLTGLEWSSAAQGKPYIPQKDINPILADIKTALETGNLTFGTEKFEKEFKKGIIIRFLLLLDEI